jgi:undecaprenyl-diphosphatase
MSTWHVILLGLIEGLTEFLPVSSTGHLLLAGHFLNFKSPGKTFEVLIQLGAILAILSVYFGKLMRLLFDLPLMRARGGSCSACWSFLPAAVVGATLHKYIMACCSRSPGSCARR